MLTPPVCHGLFHEIAVGVLTIPKQGESTGKFSVTNFFCHIGVLRELPSDEGQNFEHQFVCEVMDHLEIKMTKTTPIFMLSDGILNL